MLLESKRHGVTREVIAIVAGLTIQDPRERPVERREQADLLHARFADPTSDLLGLLNLWNHLEEQQTELSSSAFRRRCKAEFLNFVRIREWQDLVRQLTGPARDVGGSRPRVAGPRVAGRRHAATPRAATAPGLRRRHPQVGARRAALADRAARRARRAAPAARGRQRRRRGAARSEYLGARQLRFVVFPGSALAKKPPRALMSAELVETSRLFARMNAAIDPAWAEPIAGDLVKRTYGEPRWEQRQGAAVADERVTLFGVPIVEKRRIQYARLDPAHARDLFLEHALLEGEWPREVGRDPALRLRPREPAPPHARSTRRRSAPAAARSTTQRIVDFYDDAHPRRRALDVRAFEVWWRATRQETPDLLDDVARRPARRGGRAGGRRARLPAHLAAGRSAPAPRATASRPARRTTG